MGFKRRKYVILSSIGAVRTDSGEIHRKCQTNPDRSVRFPAPGPAWPPQKLQQVVKDLQAIDKLRPSVADISVPMEVFDYIDSGRNPQLYTKDCMEKAHSKNEEIKGKIDAYRMFKARLLLELTHVFPKEMAVYRATRGDERGTQ